MTLSEYLKEKTALLSRAGIPEAENEAWLCFMEATGLNRSAIRVSLDRETESCVSESVLARLEEIFARRAGHEPLAYIARKAPFYDLSFSVGPGVLIPRFDTEILVETALGALGFPQMLPGAPELPKVRFQEGAGDLAKVCAAPEYSGAQPVRILDLCTGSGCVGITIAHELKKKGIAYALTMTEKSPEASAFAEENAKAILGSGASGEKAGSGPRSDWRVEVTDLWPAGEGRYDLIVSNPPYVTSAEMGELLPEVRDHEPAMALTDEGDGLLFYRRIAAGVPAFLAPGGVLAVEHGCAQGQAVRDLMQPVLSGILTVQDYGGRDRVTCGGPAV